MDKQVLFWKAFVAIGQAVGALNKCFICELKAKEFFVILDAYICTYFFD